MRVLVVEDEAGIARDVLRALAHAGFAAEHVADGAAAWERGGTEPFDAAILDLNLPGVDGLSLLRRWRAEGVGFPILVLSARATWAVRVEAIDAGADDYLVKPFAMEELLARLRAILRRHAGLAGNVLQAGGLALDTRARRLTRDGRAVELTPLEFRLIAYLMHHAGRAVHQTELMEHLYADEADRADNAVEALVARLRRKIGAATIRTRRGHGYVIEP
ncbi:response regulator transcription factor [Roseococcus sp. SDR]|uniref:response regulator transcription factor n=1 Tax=Roseococcus sp. SDR TaxID=2835532 RepID=UPI001BCCE501|nr:response regulator transcription factor [Roseococcus sp. SDR]MBS7788546.1 response regulator transcription factor [Roseococcus sp. SDR]MBV1843860.1 response regulator transcription factor [Roseococcus sp. SDR]